MNPYEAPKTPIGPSPRSRVHGIAGSTELPFAVECSCGQRIAVGPTQAGSKVVCECGAAVAVPSLSRLRESSGIGRYEAGPADAIRRMLNQGQWPGTPVCAWSGRPTDDVLKVHVFITTQYLSTKGSGGTLFAAAFLGPLLGGFLMILATAFRGQPEPAPGSEEAVPTPLRLETRYHARARAANERKLKRLLAKAPLYAQLLEQYPLARVVVGGDS